MSSEPPPPTWLLSEWCLSARTRRNGSPALRRSVSAALVGAPCLERGIPYPSRG